MANVRRSASEKASQRAPRKPKARVASSPGAGPGSTQQGATGVPGGVLKIFRVADPQVPVPGSHKSKCRGCSHSVWLAPGTWPFDVLCWRCVERLSPAAAAARATWISKQLEELSQAAERERDYQEAMAASRPNKTQAKAPSSPNATTGKARKAVSVTLEGIGRYRFRWKAHWLSGVWAPGPPFDGEQGGPGGWGVLIDRQSFESVHGVHWFDSLEALAEALVFALPQIFGWDGPDGDDDDDGEQESDSATTPDTGSEIAVEASSDSSGWTASRLAERAKHFLDLVAAARSGSDSKVEEAIDRLNSLLDSTAQCQVRWIGRWRGLLSALSAAPVRETYYEDRDLERDPEKPVPRGRREDFWDWVWMSTTE